jgi:hypothetical protein
MNRLPLAALVLLIYPGRTHPQYRTSDDFLIDRLRK